MRYEICTFFPEEDRWYYIFDHVAQKIIPIKDADLSTQKNYGTMQECEKKLMQLLAEGGRSEV